MNAIDAARCNSLYTDCEQAARPGNAPVSGKTQAEDSKTASNKDTVAISEEARQASLSQAGGDVADLNFSLIKSLDAKNGGKVLIESALAQDNSLVAR